MKNSNQYKVLSKQTFSAGDYRIEPIRYKDRFDIMKWRNEQIFHLRQTKPLTKTDQEYYFQTVISKLFDQNYPAQILFSYLEKEKCIGYGGLVHINWVDKNAEISFIMDTQKQTKHFQTHWKNYLSLIEQVAFSQLNLHKIYTYAFDLRPHLYPALESSGYIKEAVLKEHCFFNGNFKDVIIHSKKSPISIRLVDEEDKKMIFDWTNEKQTRLNSFNSKVISFEEHSDWFDKKLKNPDAKYYIALYENQPAGLVRFDKQEDYTLIGINIARSFRGLGLSSTFLKITVSDYIKQHPEAIIRGYIKEENVASQRAFASANFVSLQKEIIGNTWAMVFELKK